MKHKNLYDTMSEMYTCYMFLHTKTYHAVFTNVTYDDVVYYANHTNSEITTVNICGYFDKFDKKLIEVFNGTLDKLNKKITEVVYNED